MSDQNSTKPDTRNVFYETAILIERLPNKKPFKPLSGLVKFFTQMFYNLISNLDRDDQLIFMNYGYFSLDPNHGPVELGPADENFRHQVQMYHHVASAVDWAGSHALEVGSGRGGGASYIMRQFKPRSMIGVDLSNDAVEFCNRYHASVEGLRFMQGDAERLMFPDESFEIVINVESSLYYPNVENFFRHVVRMLKPNGYFLYADMRYTDEVEIWKKQLQDTGLELLSEEDITHNARLALSHNQAFRMALVEKYVPRILHGIFKRFGGADGGRLSEGAPIDRKRVYKKFVFRKSRGPLV